MIDVSIVVVSYNDAADLPLSLGSALGQRGVSVEVVLADNASADDSASIGRRLGARVLALPGNVGFAGAMNAGIDATTGRYVLALNPDCRLEPDFSAVLASRLDARPDAGSASGRLLRAEGSDLHPGPTLDSAGIFFTASGRHFDRGAGEPARGRFLEE
ncbi:MAG TPA: glycosyltransferase, partial [Thermoanaerobaculia bacterium]